MLIHKNRITVEKRKKISSLLSYTEKIFFFSIKNHYKKIEYLASRFYIKKLVKKIIKLNNPNMPFIIPFKEIEIKKNKSEPILYIQKKKISSYFICISHKKPLIFVSLTKKKIGIDIEKIHPRILFLKEKFSKNSEKKLILNSLNTYSTYHYFSFHLEYMLKIYYTCLWSSKESIIKMLSSPFKKINKNISLKKIIHKKN